MKKVDFYRLPRSVQDQLLGGFRAQIGPKPILWQAGRRPQIAYWLGASSVALLLLMALVAIGFGELTTTLSSHPAMWAAGYVALVFVMALGVLQALRYSAIVRRLPFPTGLYLFAASLIDARHPRLRVFALKDLTGVAVAGPGSVVLSFGAASFTFRMDPTATDKAVKLVEAARDRARGELTAARRRSIDPLEPPIIESPLGPTEAFTAPGPWWLRMRWPLAIAIAVGAGAGVFLVRDQLSDARMFATAAANDDVDSYRRYLERGSSRRVEVTTVLLPRAALRVAAQKGTVEAIDEHMREYPDTAIAQEVELARQTALVAAFEKARAVGTLDALASFADRYPGHALDKFLAEAKRSVYTRALARYRGMMPEKAAGTLAVVEALLAHAEREGPSKTAEGYRGPKVEIRARRLPSEDLERADDVVMKSPMYRGAPSLPTRHLDASHFAMHEAAITKALAEALARGFAPEVLTFGAQSSLDGTENIPSLKVPTLVVTYRVEPSGAAYASKTPRGIFMGLGFYFQLELFIPGQAEPLRSKHNFAQAIPVKLLTEREKRPPDSELETAVYREMLRAAFEEARTRYLAQWYR